MPDLNFHVAMTMLCSVAEFRLYARIDAAEYDYLNPVILDLIAGNTYRLWDRLGGDKSIQDYDEFYDVDDYDQDYVSARHTPVIGVTAMTIHTQGLGDSVVGVADRWFDESRIGVVDRFARQSGQLYEGVAYWGKGRNQLHVNYSAGLTTSRLLPLKLAVYSETAAWMNRAGYEGVASTSGSSGFSFESTGWCQMAEAILINWGA